PPRPEPLGEPALPGFPVREPPQPIDAPAIVSTTPQASGPHPFTARMNARLPCAPRTAQLSRVDRTPQRSWHDLAIRRAGRAGRAVRRAKVASLALVGIDNEVAAEMGEPAARGATVVIAVERGVHAAAQIAFLLGGIHGAVAAVRAERALGRAAAILRVVVLRAAAQGIGR